MAHSTIVLGMLLLSYYGGQQLSLGLWMALACAWLLWPLVLFLHPARTVSRVLVPVILGGVLLLPCALPLYAFLCWSTNGFAP